jgi:(R)-2-hydroxyacyl-CoA dehydratese activating ATPase
VFYAGIDVGSLTAEAAVVEDDRLVAATRIDVLPHPVDSARAVLDELLAEAAIPRSQIARTVATGYGRTQVEAAGLADANVSEIYCHGFGAFCLDPRTRTVIDIGGQDAKAIRVSAAGALEDFVMNDKCAAGTGHFLELMARALEVELEELGPLAQRARRPVEMSNRCSIFVETEVLHYLQRSVDKADIAAGIAQSMASRVVALVRRVKPGAAVVMTGGVAKNVAVRIAIEKQLGLRVTPLKADPQIVGAFGAARLAREQGGAS